MGYFPNVAEIIRNTKGLKQEFAEEYRQFLDAVAEHLEKAVEGEILPQVITEAITAYRQDDDEWKMLHLLATLEIFDWPEEDPDVAAIQNSYKEFLTKFQKRTGLSLGLYGVAEDEVEPCSEIPNCFWIVEGYWTISEAGQKWGDVLHIQPAAWVSLD